MVKGVRGNAATAGLSVGDTIVYASSFFGDELVSSICVCVCDVEVWLMASDRTQNDVFDSPPLLPLLPQWPTDDLNFTRSAIAAAPSPVVLVYVKGENTNVNVKRLPKKPAPPRFGRKLTAAQKALATHICVDCGWIYCEKTPFAEAAASGLKCEQCGAPPRRFATFNADTGKLVGGTPDALATNLTVIVGLLGVGVLAYLGLSL